MPQYESLDVPTDTAERSGWFLKCKRIRHHSCQAHALFIYLFFILLAYSIDSDSMTHLTAPTDLVDGCHKQLSQVWQFNTEVLYSKRFCKQRVPHCVQNENDCRGPPSPFQGHSHLSAPSACRLSASVAPCYVVADVS